MILKEIDLFKGIDYKVLEKIADISTEETFNKGDRIFRQGEKAENLYILVEGSLNLVLEGSAPVLSFNLTEPGAVFGWSGMAQTGRYTSSGVCGTDLKAIKLEWKKLEPIFKDCPDIGFQVLRQLMNVLSDRLLNAYQLLLDSYEKL